MALSRVIPGRFLMNTFYHMRVYALGRFTMVLRMQKAPSLETGGGVHWLNTPVFAGQKEQSATYANYPFWFE